MIEHCAAPRVVQYKTYDPVAESFWPQGNRLEAYNVALHNNYQSSIYALWFQTRLCLCFTYISLYYICDPWDGATLGLGPNIEQTWVSYIAYIKFFRREEYI